MNKPNPANIPSPPILAGILLIGFALRVLAFSGIFGADDVAIALVAKDFLENGFSAPEGHYAQRIGLILPLALIFKLFGTGDWQFALLPMAASMGSIILAYLIGRTTVSEQVGLLAAFFLAIFPLDVANASMLFPDAIMGACISLAFYLILRAEQCHALLQAFAGGILIGMGWLIKVEAPILIPVLGVYWLLAPARRWRTVLLACIGALIVLLTEGAIYYSLTGDFLRGIHAAINQGGGITNEAYSATQLWIFPKAWFVTAYEFGLHYYLLFAATAWVVIYKRKECYVLLVWVVLMLLWLEFGGNPFAAEYRVKSHLTRYCLTIAVPSVVLIATMLADVWNRGHRRIALTLVAGATAAALFLAVFNTLALDGIRATKLGLDYAVERNAFPLYLDKKSYDMATWYLGDRIDATMIVPIQQHDFKTQTTQLLPVDEIRGWVLDNRVFAEYALKRYGMRPVSGLLHEPSFWIEKTIDNPGSRLAYAQAELLMKIIGLMPEHYLTSKARGTLDSILEGSEVTIYRTGSLPSNSRQ